MQARVERPRVKRFTMRFEDSDLERRYRVSAALGNVRVNRVACILATLQYASFGVLDTIAVPSGHKALLIIRFAVVCPALLLTFGITFTDLYVRRQQELLAVAVLVPSLGLVAMLRVAPVPADYIAMGTMLVLIYVLTFIRMSFIYGVTSCLLIVAAYEYGILTFTSVRGVQFLYPNFFLVSALIVGATASYTIERFSRNDFSQAQIIEAQRVESERLLLNILPEPIAARLKASPGVIADVFDDVTVLFADIVDFTPMSSQLSPHDLVQRLDDVFTTFDELCALHGLEKIKTIGDAYMAVAGVPRARDDHAIAAAEMALDMRAIADRVSQRWMAVNGDELRLRIGLASGPVVAGVIGSSKFAYDLWGDTVNTASRMESHGEPAAIQVEASTYERLTGRYTFSAPRTVVVKGKGPMTTYLLTGRVSDDVDDGDLVAVS